eukprot:NODE_3627_length_762_cov_217.216407.p1 GENE.NODE_3627_length_762_cov_217.216407~~NODE_3627_length_762_cov_217.216407.p1  ORF type:complete len:187 (+),score=61.95 NODE_3627_length_762_cov_217.216407:3-563(+)
MGDAVMEDIPLYDISEAEEQHIERDGGDSTYGELSYELLDWALARVDVGAGDVICDLGSGGGRMLCYLALRTGCDAVGVELSPTRHAHASKMLDLLRPHLRPGQSVHLQEGSFVEDGPQRDATVVLIANKLFTDECTERALRTVPRARALLVLKEVPTWFDQPSLAAELPTSWSMRQPVWLYRRSA